MQFDVTRTGRLGGAVVKDIFSKSGLAQVDLGQIW